MKISVASGKGGTGKTTIAVNLALSLLEEYEVQLLDCDVEEPNAALFLEMKPEFLKNVSLKNPVFDEETCTLCGKCGKFCAYHAIAVLPKKVLFFPELCHGCGGCEIICPVGAISETERPIGKIEHAKAGNFEFLQGVLKPGEAMATPVIRELKKKIREDRITILDSPPGNACPVIETMRDSDFCVLVTEPTPFGLSDLKITIEILRSLAIPFGVVINRDGIGDQRTEEFCQKEGIEVLMKIPEDKRIAHSYSLGVPFTYELPEFCARFIAMYQRINELVAGSDVGVGE